MKGLNIKGFGLFWLNPFFCDLKLERCFHGEEIIRNTPVFATNLNKNSEIMTETYIENALAREV
jgi:hypothetical protein